jgi:hypothetical protein
VREFLTSDKGRRSLVVDMLTTKAIARLTAIARGEAVPALETSEEKPVAAPAA